MSRAVAVLFCAGLLTASAGAKADEIYRLCGPGTAGVIRVGAKLACIKGAPAPGPPQAAAKPQPAAKAGANKEVDDALNRADLAFREGDTKNACGWVSSAITSDITELGGVKSSKEQREQLKKYAQRCNLRY